MYYRYEKDGFVVSGGGDSSKDFNSASTKGLAVNLKDGAKMPVRATEGDAGADMFAYITDVDNYSIVVPPGGTVLVDTGVAVKIPVGYGGFIMPRSSMRAKGISSNGDGLIDSGYRGTIKVVVQNHSNSSYEIGHGDKIGQLVVQKVELVDFVDIWNDAERGTGGFGSTGK